MKKQKKLIVLGIDSLDHATITKYLSVLPNIRELINNQELRLNSIFPVDSIPAWVSIYTGQNPANHGIVKTFDVFDNSIGEGLLVDVNKIKGKTFWDYLSKQGMKTVIMYPLMAFPPWDSNGLMISKGMADIEIPEMNIWNIKRELLVYPPNKQEPYDILPFMNGISGKHPGIHNLLSWSDDAKQTLNEEFELCLKIMQKEDWNFCFVYFSLLDIIDHRFWRFCDHDDPTYPGSNKFENVIKDFYIRFDTMIGELLKNNPDVPLLIISDHGHGQRPTQVVNINMVLRKNSLYYSNNQKIQYVSLLLETCKRALLKIVNDLELDFWLVKLATKTANISKISKNLYSSQPFSKKSKHLAKLSSFAGLKSYSHGGIEISSDNSKNSEYEIIREKIIELLTQLRDPKSGELLMEWVFKREKLYNGKFTAEVFPDIVFKLKDEYGTGWNIYSSLITKANDHNLASGGHKSEAVLLFNNIERKLDRKVASLMDIAPTILDLMEIDPTNYPFDGKTIFQTRKKT